MFEEELKQVKIKKENIELDIELMLEEIKEKRRQVSKLNRVIKALEETNGDE